jgi:hypothetical protein
MYDVTNTSYKLALARLILYLTGGLSAFGALRHLGWATRVGRHAMQAAVSKTTTLRLLTNVVMANGGSTILTSTGGFFASLGLYISNTATNPQTKALGDKMGLLCGAFAMGIGLLGLRGRLRIEKLSKDVISELNITPSSLVLLSSPDLIELERILLISSGNNADTISKVTAIFDTMFPTGSNNIYPIFNRWSDALKQTAIAELKLLNLEIGFATKLNTKTHILTRYEELYTRGLINERKDITNVLDNVTTYNSILKFTDDVGLRQVLIDFRDVDTKLALYNRLGNLNNKLLDILKTKPSLITDYLKSSFKPELSAGRYFWIKVGYSGLDIKKIINEMLLFRNTNNKFVGYLARIRGNPNLLADFTNRAKKNDCILLLKQSGSLGKIGDVLEIPFRNYLAQNSPKHLSHMFEVDLRFVDRNGEKVFNRFIKEMDHLLIDNEITEIQEMTSLKFSKRYGITKLLAEELSTLQRYASLDINNFEDFLLKCIDYDFIPGNVNLNAFNRITDAIIIYKDVNGIERTMPFVDFQRMAKSTYNTSNIQVVKLNSITEQIEFPVANSNHYLVTSGAKTQFSSVKQIDIYEALYELIHNQLQN